MRTEKIFVCCFLLLLLFASCSTDELREQLVNIERLLQDKRNEEAYSLLNVINPEVIENEEDLSLYWLLKMQVDCRLGNTVVSLKPLESSVEYFEKNKNYRRLAWACYYMGYFLEDIGDRVNAIKYLKKGERIAYKTKQIDILHHILQVVAGINHDAKEYDLALKYGKLALGYAFKLKDSVNLANDMMNLAASYNAINKMDSSFYYIKKMMPFLEAVPKEKRTNYYANIGLVYKGVDNNLSKKYLLKSVEIEHNPYSYKVLAQIYLKDGDKQKAEAMWAKALDTKDLSLKANVVKDIANVKEEEGDYQAAHELTLWVTALKDSLHLQQREENIKGQQELFEHEETARALEKKNYEIRIAAGLLILLIGILLLWLLHKKRIVSRLIQQLHNDASKKDEEIVALQQADFVGKKKINELAQEMENFKRTHHRLLERGQYLYDQIMDGGNTLTWTKKDFVCFVQYYKLRNAEFVASLENDYDDLSPRLKTFEILYDMGMTTSEVMRILVLSESSVRANRSRIKSSRLIKDEAN